MKTEEIIKTVDLDSITYEGDRLDTMSNEDILNNLIVMNWRIEQFNKLDENIKILFENKTWNIDGKTIEAWIVIFTSILSLRKKEKDLLVIEKLKREQNSIDAELEALESKKTKVAKLKKKRAEIQEIINNVSDKKILTQ